MYSTLDITLAWVHTVAFMFVYNTNGSHPCKCKC